MDSLGTYLRRVRNDRGLTLLDVRGAGGPAASILSHIENDLQRPTPEVCERLARIYGVPLDELVALRR